VSGDRLLHELVVQSAARTPEAVAVRWGDDALTYGQLDALANRIARWLQAHGVGAGDRVAVWLHKGGHTIAAMQAALRIGAAYVPVDPMSPPPRARMILEDCGVKAVVTRAAWAEAALTEALADVPCLPFDAPFRGVSWSDLDALSADALPTPARSQHDLAYILYTSGSTGRPKGVCISHLNALAFIDWSVATVEATAADKFSNHAPFHFDLSVLDLYAAFCVGGTVCLVTEGGNYSPAGLVELIERHGITVWYSVPSALILMMDHGGLLTKDAPSLRVVLFAGEPFPIKHLRRLRDHWPSKRFLNLYGPTETNVCTAYEVHDLPESLTAIPIGRATCGDEVWAVKEDGSPAAVGEEGELICKGPTVMLGYYGQPPVGDKPYPTGDIVRQDAAGDYHYVGRRDHMVKVQGFRIELGEIENALLAHPDIHEAAVLVRGEGSAAKLVAFLSATGDNRPSLVQLKQHCADRLPRYMIVDQARWFPALPRTRNGKIDRLTLASDYDANKAEPKK
jgi:amino acid adenylation domain-containing protein